MKEKLELSFFPCDHLHHDNDVMAENGLYVEKSNFFRMLVEWMEDINVERQDGREKYAFQTIFNQKGIDNYAISRAYEVYDYIQEGHSFASPHNMTLLEDGLSKKIILRPFYYAFGALYALLYINEELACKHKKFISELKHVLDTEHHDAFVSLKRMLWYNFQLRMQERQLTLFYDTHDTQEKMVNDIIDSNNAVKAEKEKLIKDWQRLNQEKEQIRIQKAEQEKDKETWEFFKGHKDYFMALTPDALIKELSLREDSELPTLYGLLSVLLPQPIFKDIRNQVIAKRKGLKSKGNVTNIGCRVFNDSARDQGVSFEMPTKEQVQVAAVLGNDLQNRPLLENI